VKLLRAIEQKELTPVGYTDPITIDLRIIAATNRDLRQEVENGKFREDLFYRLNVVEVDLPSLSERKEDIPLLCQHFLEVYKKHMGRPIQGFTNEAMSVLMQYQWKGEVRELENVVERAVIFCDKELISLEHLPDYFRQVASQHSTIAPGGHQTLRDAVKAFERTYIEQVLAQNDRNKEATAQALGVSLSSLYRKMEELEIPTR
jgi:two-component system response regulator PilR (NtrC family)